MKNVLILCEADPKSDPRPNRMINWLKDTCNVTVITRSNARLEGVQSIPAQTPVRTSTLMKVARKLPGSIKKIIRLPILLNHLIKIKRGRYEDLLWPVLELTKRLQEQLGETHFDLIITHDCSLLPLAFGLKKEATKVLLDAREYYPRNYDDQLKWRLQFKPINEYLCSTYLPLCDKVITVSDGLAREYMKHYQAQPEVIMSLPTFHDLQPSIPDEKKIKMIYHGWASPSRRTEIMIELMDHLDERFSLDLMLLLDKSEYAEKIVSMARTRENIRIIPPIPMQELIPSTNSYDIGLFLCPPTNLNLTYTLPNKLFEFIQARLAVAIGPGIEMRKIVDRYGCGIVSEDFSPLSLARELNRLTPEKILHYKNRSNKAAKELNEETNRKRMREILQELVGV